MLLILLILAVSYGYDSYFDRNEIANVPKLDFEENPEITKGHVPKICTGIVSKEHSKECPPNFAFMTAEDRSPSSFGETAASVSLRGVCCELPANDILTDEHAYNVEGECPANYITTGASGHGCSNNCFMRCTRINTNRYTLGKKYQGVYWKREGTDPGGGRGGAAQIMFLEVPVALRFGTGFSWDDADRGEEPWDIDGCISAPFGSVIVEKRSSGCGGLYFKPLLFKQGGKAVRTYPECDTIGGILEKKPFCQQHPK